MQCYPDEDRFLAAMEKIHLVPTIEDHHVILESRTLETDHHQSKEEKKKQLVTKGTKIWRESVRFVFGNKDNLSEKEVQCLRELQNEDYKKTYQGKQKVSFWVEAPATSGPHPKERWLEKARFIPASKEDLRKEIQRFGSPPQHHVILKSKKSEPTEGTVIWKNKVRFLFGKKNHATDEQLRFLKRKQNSYYGPNQTVVFWVEAPDKPQNQGADCVRKFILAIDQDIRTDIRNNGVDPQQRSGKRKKTSEAEDDHSTMTHFALHSLGQCDRLLEALKQHKDPIKAVEACMDPNHVLYFCKAWMNSNRDNQGSEKWVKTPLVRGFVEDISDLLHLSLSAAFCATDCYDSHRKVAKEAMVLEGINKLGQAMLDWYRKDYQKRYKESPLVFHWQAPPQSCVCGTNKDNDSTRTMLTSTTCPSHLDCEATEGSSASKDDSPKASVSVPLGFCVHPKIFPNNVSRSKRFSG